MANFVISAEIIGCLASSWRRDKCREDYQEFPDSDVIAQEIALSGFVSLRTIPSFPSVQPHGKRDSLIC